MIRRAFGLVGLCLLLLGCAQEPVDGTGSALECSVTAYTMDWPEGMDAVLLSVTIVDRGRTSYLFRVDGEEVTVRHAHVFDLRIHSCERTDG